MGRTKDHHTLTEAFDYSFFITNPRSHGIFYYLYLQSYDYEAQRDRIPWDKTLYSDQTLDFEYFGNMSGDKLCCPFIEKILKLTDKDKLENIQHVYELCYMILNRFSDNWTKRWEALQTEYNPLENYSMLEELTDDDTTVTHGKTTTRTGSVELTPEAVTTVESSVYAYDSDLPTPDAKTVSTPTGSNTTEYNDLTDTEGGTTETSHGYEKTRSGNIGVTTSQQMLQAELEVRMYDFFRSVYADVDKVLTIPVY